MGYHQVFYYFYKVNVQTFRDLSSHFHITFWTINSPKDMRTDYINSPKNMRTDYIDYKIIL